MGAIHVWRRVLNAIFGPITRSLEARRIRQSYTAPLLCGAGRDRVRYYRSGRSVDVGAELLTGSIQRRIYYSQPLSWRETGELLTTEEAQQVIDAVCHHFDSRKVKWALYPPLSAAT
jgi:hypothetical protein